ncbi:MAG: metallophosphoesterase [Ruminococcus sp.]|nr:metallophosphoesterase [Ruminococcus sp.]
MVWIILLLAILVLFAAGVRFISSRALRSGFAKKLYAEHKRLGRLVSLWPLALCVPLGIIAGTVGAIVAFLHIVVIWTLCDLIGFIVNKIKKRERSSRYLNGYIAVGITAVYLCAGWYFAHHVFRTDYTLHTGKTLGQESLRIALIADAHLVTTLDEDGLEDVIDRINDDEPDIVTVCGDFIDDDTSKSEMLAGCSALGGLHAKYGVYFVYGNHDKGYYDNRGYNCDEFEEALKNSGVRILCDETELINDSIYIVGRKDRSDKSRLSAQELTEKLDRSKYIVMLDHQPNDYKNEAESGADLVLSGHTHGGHIFPIGPLSLLFGANDKVYGKENRDGTEFIVTSGVSGWAIPFKTFSKSEYVIIDVVGQ